jgi:hypothetical protein
VSGKPGRSGRPAIGGPKVAMQVRLELDETEAFDRMVDDRAKLAATANRASVLRALVRAALIEEGYMDAPPAKPKKKGTQR